MDVESVAVRGQLGPNAEAVMRRWQRRQLSSSASGTQVPRIAGSMARLADDIGALADARTSVRTFTQAPVTEEDVLGVCAGAVDASLLLGPPATPPRWLVLALNVVGTQRSVLDYDEGLLSPLAPLPDDALLIRSMQPTFVHAACILYPVWDLGEALATGGTDGYANLLMRAGASLYGGWLTAISRGLGGCLFRGPHPALLHAVLGLGGLDSRPFLALAIGSAGTPEAMP